MKNEDNSRIVKFNEFYKSDPTEEFTPDPIDSEFTGLPMMVWLYTLGNKGQLPILKVQNTYTDKIDSDIRFTITISDAPKIINGDTREITDSDLEKVFTWIILNKKILIDMWDEKIDDDEFFEKMIFIE
jgi:hypothetical protein